MEAIANLKQGSDDIDIGKCLICQAEKSEKLRSCMPQGIKAVKEAAKERAKRKNAKNRDTIDRVLDCVAKTVSWHKGCYTSFTSKTLISRLNVSKPQHSESSKSYQDQKCLWSRNKTIYRENVFFVKKLLMIHFTLLCLLTLATQSLRQLGMTINSLWHWLVLVILL